MKARIRGHKIVSFLPYEKDYLIDFLTRKVDSEKFDLVCCNSLDFEEVMRHLNEATIILHGPVEPFLSQEILEAAPNLQLIQFGSIGYAQVDINAASKLKIPVANNAAFCSISVAEYTIMAILLLLRQTLKATSGIRDGNWNAQEMISETNDLHELNKMTLGILGLGSIGSWVARIAKGFGCKTIYNKRNRLPINVEHDLGVEFVEFNTLIRNADVLTIHAPLTDQTRNLINRNVLAQMKTGSYIINTARRDLIDEEALYEALVLQKIRGACIDVPRSPNDREKFLLKYGSLDNVLVTPHISALTIDSMERSKNQLSENVRRIIEGEKPLFVINETDL